jgi:hypothetical protein
MDAMSEVGRKMAARGGPGSRMAVMEKAATAEREKARFEAAVAEFDRKVAALPDPAGRRWRAFLDHKA